MRVAYGNLVVAYTNSIEAYTSTYRKRFKYYFGSQPLAFVSNWSSTFQPCVKMVLAVKCWMENAEVANSFF